MLTANLTTFIVERTGTEEGEDVDPVTARLDELLLRITELERMLAERPHGSV